MTMNVYNHIAETNQIKSEMLKIDLLDNVEDTKFDLDA